jgi:hypothetical protein
MTMASYEERKDIYKKAIDDVVSAVKSIKTRKDFYKVFCAFHVARQPVYLHTQDAGYLLSASLQGNDAYSMMMAKRQYEQMRDLHYLSPNDRANGERALYIGVWTECDAEGNMDFGGYTTYVKVEFKFGGKGKKFMGVMPCV